MSVGIDAKVALILGGAGGIGSAAARDLEELAKDKTREPC